jgi:chromosomal replication initiation ATPase DnaA
MRSQLSLPFMSAPDYAPEDFCAAPSNALAREWLARPEGWTNGRLILWGATGCGKTHLLRIWAAGQNALVLNGAQLQGPVMAPERPLAIDDADASPEPRTLLHVLNAAAEAGRKVLLTARDPPSRQALKLADLASRLRASLAVEIGAPEDDLLELLLSRLASERQLNLSPSVRKFLLRRLPRTAGALREAVARLDRAAFERGARISRLMAAGLLEDIFSPGTAAPEMLPNRHLTAGDGLL